ncbi:hypothetical protein DLM86_26090 [Paenibacillus flagellatus]|uniref:SLH domain-containing protein n=2 Tax=Paenibacillus flagellatus TaxID=2211139 RepID=A0A2V5JY04_9BACL|nr:hypothetical protein DLM86_26090 [Paenibacillus flagellatus]
MLTLVVSLLPPLTVNAAPTAPGFFFPDDLTLRAKANPTDPVDLSRSSGDIYIAKSKLFTITGNYNHVSADTMTVTVELMEYVGGTWKPAADKVFSAGITPLANQKFEARNLDLFSGYNRITLKGRQGAADKKDVFYVLYQDAPVLKSLRVGSGADPVVNLNEGASIVVKNKDVYMEGTVENATRLSVNGSSVTPLEDGTFFAPALSLNPGKNEITIDIENPSNKVTVKRTIYYYDPLDPFVAANLLHSSKSYPILNKKPTSTGTDSTAQLEIEMLVPYKSAAFGTGATVQTSVYGGGTVTGFTVAAADDQVIMDNLGVTPTYRKVKFKTDAAALAVDGSSAILKEQRMTVSITYDDFAIIEDFNFIVLPDELYIENMYLLPNYSGSGLVGNKVALDKSEVSTDSFYVVATTNKAVTTESLTAVLLPLGTTALTVTPVTPVDDPATSGVDESITGLVAGKEYLYRVSGLPSGSQKVSFKYSGTNSSYAADINFVSTQYVFLNNVYDGQFITITGTGSLTIDGQFVGFKNPLGVNAEFFVNGTRYTDGDPLAGPADSKFDLDGENKFKNVLSIGTSGDLYFGENRLVYRATYLDPSTNVSRIIEKSIRLYVNDTNVPTLSRFQPIVVPNGIREPLAGLLGSTGTVYDTKLGKIFIPSNDIQFTNNRYVTSRKTYDVGFIGSGATNIVVRQGGEIIFEATWGTSSFNISGPKSASVEQDNVGGAFVFRLNNQEFPSTGTHVYTIELRNANGVKITQSMELVREVSAYRIVAPKPNVGDRIIVNKNFVSIDIEAEGATEVLVDGKPAEKRADRTDRYYYEYVGLKPDKETSIKVSVKQGGKTLNDTVKVYYTAAVEPGAQYMEQMGAKHSVFNKSLSLTFPKGTLLEQNNPQTGYPQYYDKQKLLFGIADPTDGVVERVDDYGNIVNRTGSGDERRPNANPVFTMDRLRIPFISELGRQNFTRVSSIFWISGGLGEQGAKNTSSYKPALNGVNPYPYNVEMPFTAFPADRKLTPTQRGELTLKFDENVVTNALTTVTVYHFNDKGQWKNIGGTVNAKDNTITVPFYDFGYYMVAKLRYGFSDITRHGWARNVLEALFAKGIMPNLRTDEFGADDYISRGEFTTMLVKSLNIPLNYDNTQSFIDVVPVAQGMGAGGFIWDYAHIETAARAGIITGLENRIFGAGQRLNREQAAVMIARALELKTSLNDAKLEAKLKKLFTDEITFYARPSVEAVYNAGIMQGIPNELGNDKSIRFDGESPLTRAQAAQITVRLLQKVSDIFPKNFN